MKIKKLIYLDTPVLEITKTVMSDFFFMIILNQGIRTNQIYLTCIQITF